MNSDLIAQSERALLGSIMLDNAQWSHATTLSASDFLLSSHVHIFGCMNVMFEDQRPVDNVTLAQELEKIGKLQSVGDYAYLSQLIGEGTTVLDVAGNVKYVKEASTERKWNTQLDLLSKASSPGTRTECLNVLQDLCNGTASQSAGELIVVRGDQAQEKPLRWMWKHYLPLGKLVHFGGESSQAKSPVTVNLAARVSIGAEWPDRTKNTLGPRSVIMLNVEDDFEDTILPRYRAAGGDKSKLYYVKGTQIADGAKSAERMFALDSDMQKLAKLARSLPDLGLIVIDPVTNYLGNKKFIDEGEIRSVLTPLANLAGELGIVVNTVGHFNRREKGTSPLHRIMGAAAFHGVARAVWTFGPDPESESKYAHVMTAARGCGGEGAALRYHTELHEDEQAGEVITVFWDGHSDATAEDSVDPTPLRDKAQEDEAAAMVRELLRDGKRPAKECEEALKSEGYDLTKLNAGRIRKKAGASSKKFPGDNYYSWYIPTPGSLIQ
jgi:putative DNA primase/helicase